MAKCMQQDCAQSMEEVGCKFVTARLVGGAALCYTNLGQMWCDANPTSPDCAQVSPWRPVDNIPFRGQFAAKPSTKYTNEPTFTCVCAKKCSSWKSKKALRCADGWELVGNPETSPFQREHLNQDKGDRGIYPDSGKSRQCACVCGSSIDGRWLDPA
mmetsp:Transcript_89600/g.145098  ORF Transcript_89600/g.145098 Transcript_89600/m.145098 type:complete len:157 (+) Transcript_89600:2-472(+)